MALAEQFEKSGNKLFRYRGYIPLILYAVAVPMIYYTDYSGIPQIEKVIINSISYLVTALGFFTRAWAIGTTPKGTSGRNTRQQVAEALNRTGIYSMVRHPLYLGNFLVWMGIVIFTYNIYFIIIVALAFWIYYERIMYAEESFLRKKFGNVYNYWSEKVPAFFPSIRHFEKSEIPFSLKSVLRREYSGFMAIVISYTFIDQLRFWVIYEQYDPYRFSMIALAAAAVITLILRTLKHQTNLLKEEGRS
ncbi:MAG: isoprenylcysteine carboxylmethyltransferase family protein [Bacteroidales bacterium]|nr:isoprenylcysteine carboxylmethyltransferase family protein [Bacteroidales bacterium]